MRVRNVAIFTSSLILILTLFSGFPAIKENKDSASQTFTEEEVKKAVQSILKNLQKKIPEQWKKDEIPGVAVVVVDDKKILWLESFGYTDTSKKKPIDSDTLFSIQSASKSFTSLAVLVAVEEGLLNLDAPIKTYLPEFSVHSIHEDNPEDKITLRHLLSHAAGFTHIAPNYDEDSPRTFEEHIKNITHSWLKYPVGYHFAYSNLGINLAGYILQLKSGMPFEQYLKKKVLNPLRMKKSTFDMDVITKSKNRALGHYPDVKELPVKMELIPAGGLYTNAREMAHYLRFLLNKGKINGQSLISEKLMEEMFSVAFPLKNERFGYGLGIWRQGIATTYMLYHGGRGYGFTSGMVIYPELKLGVAVLTNSEVNELDLLSVRMMIEPDLWSEYGYGEPVPEICVAPDPTALPATDLRIKQVLGRYGSADSRVIGFKDNVLGISMGDEFYPVKLFVQNGELIGKFGKFSEFWFLPRLSDRPGTLVIKHRYWDMCNFFDYNDGPNDKPGLDKPEWNIYLGDYVRKYHGKDYQEYTVLKKNGHLYLKDQYSDMKCVEYKPGLFFTCYGEALDFRGEIPTIGNIKLLEKFKKQF